MSLKWAPVETRMWRDEDMARLSMHAKLLWAYILTCPDTSILSGVFRWNRTDAAYSCQMTVTDVDAAISELANAGKVRLYAPHPGKSAWLWIVNRVALHVRSAQQARGCLAQLEECPPELRTAVITYHQAHLEAKLGTTLTR